MNTEADSTPLVVVTDKTALVDAGRAIAALNRCLELADRQRAIVLLTVFGDSQPFVSRICEVIRAHPEIFGGRGGEPLLRIAAEFLENTVAFI